MGAHFLIGLPVLVAAVVRLPVGVLTDRYGARWLGGLLSAYRDRILPVTTDVAEEWGRLNALPKPLPVVDGLIAATAKVHRLTLVTRNVADVVRAGVTVVNPFEAT